MENFYEGLDRRYFRLLCCLSTLHKLESSAKTISTEELSRLAWMVDIFFTGLSWLFTDGVGTNQHNMVSTIAKAGPWTVYEQRKLAEEQASKAPVICFLCYSWRWGTAGATCLHITNMMVCDLQLQAEHDLSTSVLPVSAGLSEQQKQNQNNVACHIFIESKYSITRCNANLATKELDAAGFHKTRRFVDSSSRLLTVMMMLKDNWNKWRSQHKSFFLYLSFAISLPGRYF